MLCNEKSVKSGKKYLLCISLLAGGLVGLSAERHLPPLQWAIGLNEFPFETERFRDFLREGFDAVGLGCVVATAIQIEAFFLGEVEVFLAELAGDEGVASLCLQVGKGAASAAGEDGDGAELPGAVFDRRDAAGKLGSEALAEGGAGRNTFGEDSDVCSFVGEESVEDAEAEGSGEQGVVPDFRMGIEREVAGVNGEVGLEGGLEAGVVISGDGNGVVPIHSMVDNEEIDAAPGGGLEGESACIDGGTDFGHLPIVFELEAIFGTGKIFDFGAAGAFVTVSTDFLESCHGWKSECLGGLRQERKRALPASMVCLLWVGDGIDGNYI